MCSCVYMTWCCIAGIFVGDTLLLFICSLMHDRCIIIIVQFVQQLPNESSLALGTSSIASESSLELPHVTQFFSVALAEDESVVQQSPNPTPSGVEASGYPSTLTTGQAQPGMSRILRCVFKILTIQGWSQLLYTGTAIPSDPNSKSALARGLAIAQLICASCIVPSS